MKITIGIAAYKEPLISKCLNALLAEKINAEFIVVCPDDETASIVKKFKSVKLIKEAKKEGKPSAINKILAAAKGDIIVLTDADMFINKGSLKELLKPFKEKRVSVVCGHPVTNNAKGMIGFWARILYDIVHKKRLNGSKHLTTNLCAFRRDCISKIPNESLVDDYVIGLECLKKGEFVYVHKAIVNVNFPTNLSDFLKQRRRTFAGYLQVKKWYGKSERSLFEEVSNVNSVFSYVKSIKELFYVLMLALFRLIAWFLAFYDFKIKKKSLSKIWVPVNSTKH